MSYELISHNPDLKRLRDEGYDVGTRAGYLLIKNVPYVNADRKVKFGTLVSELTLAGNRTEKPGTHVAFFSGEHPCDKSGTPMVRLVNASDRQTFDRDIVVNHSFSSKPSEGYKDYYDKVTTYVAIVSGPAEAIDPKVTARTFPVMESEEDGSVFNYVDTASSRAAITAVSRKLEENVAIVGLGGTGTYVLDLVAKTPVKAIHLFDGDVFSQHNAFRSPGAPSIAELRRKPRKVTYFRRRYAKMHRNIVAHPFYVTAANVRRLKGMDFVFLCLDGGAAKEPIIARLERYGVPFIDVGMGLVLDDDSLLGILRVTTSTAEKRGHVRGKNRISFSDGGDDLYSRNIQVADLNALNAALAVVKWKKLRGFYKDLDNEHHSTYTIDGNMLLNEDKQ